MNSNIFEYHERISNSSSAPLEETNNTATGTVPSKARQWDYAFIEETLISYKKTSTGLAKVWVCGPPPMTETFDTSLVKLAPKLGLDPLTDIEIM
jgi:hypothetical protein